MEKVPHQTPGEHHPSHDWPIMGRWESPPWVLPDPKQAHEAGARMANMFEKDMFRKERYAKTC